MRLAVFSDTHGNKEAIRDALQSEGPFDLLVHLGDGFEDGLSVSKETGVEFYGVRGNEDFNKINITEELTFSVGNWTITAIHGHQMDINPYHSPSQWQQNFNTMVKWAKRKKSQLFLFGHTHCPDLREIRGIVICNPGDQYIGSTKAPSFAVVHAKNHLLTVQLMERFSKGIWHLKESLEKPF